MTGPERLLNWSIAAVFTAAAAALAALGLGVLHMPLPYGTRFWGSLAILAAVGLTTGGMSADN